MTNVDLRRIRERLEMTQQQLANQLDISVRTLKRYEAGSGPIPKMVEMAIKLLKKERLR